MASLNRVRWHVAAWKAARHVRPVIERLWRMKSANRGRPFCGILLTEHIGDIIACEPVIADVRARQSGAFVVWVTKPQYAALLTSHPGLDAVMSVDSLLEIREIVESGVFDSFVDLHLNLKPTSVRGLLYAKGTGDRSINPTNYFRFGSLLRSLSKGAGVDVPASAPRLFLPERAVAAVDRLALPDQFVVVHATSNLDLKDWSPAKWRDLVHHILDRYDTHVIELGLKGAIDVEHARFKSLCGAISLEASAEVIRRSAFFIGVDSGPAHIANAFQRPALLLFGRFYDSDAFTPYEGFYADMVDTVILRHPGLLRDMSADTAIAALERSPLWKAVHGPLIVGTSR